MLSETAADTLLTATSLLAEKARDFVWRHHLEESLKEVFHRVDEDGDGVISTDEFLNFLDQNVLDLNSRAYELFDLLDVDGSQTLDFEEWRVFYYLLTQQVCGVCKRIVVGQGFMICSACLEVGEVHGECFSCFAGMRKRADEHKSHRFEYVENIVEFYRSRQKLSGSTSGGALKVSLSGNRHSYLLGVQTRATEDGLILPHVPSHDQGSEKTSSVRAQSVPVSPRHLKFTDSSLSTHLGTMQHADMLDLACHFEDDEPLLSKLSSRQPSSLAPSVMPSAGPVEHDALQRLLWPRHLPSSAASDGSLIMEHIKEDARLLGHVLSLKSVTISAKSAVQQTEGQEARHEVEESNPCQLSSPAPTGRLSAQYSSSHQPSSSLPTGILSNPPAKQQLALHHTEQRGIEEDGDVLRQRRAKQGRDAAGLLSLSRGIEQQVMLLDELWQEEWSGSDASVVDQDCQDLSRQSSASLSLRLSTERQVLLLDQLLAAQESRETVRPPKRLLSLRLAREQQLFLMDELLKLEESEVVANEEAPQDGLSCVQERNRVVKFPSTKTAARKVFHTAALKMHFACRRMLFWALSK